MKLRLNRKAPLPVHAQLKAQLAHLIETGRWAAGTRLPTVRQLAGTLRINRNTVSKVFGELERERYLSCERGRGTFVSPRKRERKRAGLGPLLATIDEATRAARRLGLAPAAVAAAVYARALSGPPARRRRSVLFVECCRSRLQHLGRELAGALPARVESLLLEDLRRLARRSPRALRRYALVATTFCHVNEVKRLLGGSALDVVGLLTAPRQETLMRLAALPRGARVAVTEGVRLAVGSAGLTHVRLLRSPGARALRRGKPAVVVCSSRAARKLTLVAGRGAEVVVDDGRLDRAGIETIRRRLEP